MPKKFALVHQTSSPCERVEPGVCVHWQQSSAMFQPLMMYVRLCTRLSPPSSIAKWLTEMGRRGRANGGIWIKTLWTVTATCTLTHLSVVCLPPMLGNRRGIDMSEWNKPLYLGHNPAYIPYKYPISACCAQCVTGRYGYLWNSSGISQRHLNTTEDSGGFRNLERGVQGVQKFWGCQAHFRSRKHIHDTRNYCRS